MLWGIMKFPIKLEEISNIKNKILYFYSSNLEYHDKIIKMISKLDNKEKFYAINIDSDKDLIKRFNFKSTPTFIIFKNNKQIKIEGIMPFKNFKKFFTIA